MKPLRRREFGLAVAARKRETLAVVPKLG